MLQEPVIIFTTASSAESAGIAKTLIEEHLAACVNVTGVTSFYRWEGEFCQDQEHLLIIKTTRDRADAAMSRIREIHSYDLPEMILLPVAGGYPPYLQWVRDEVRQ
ncbi:MAG: divalent-cation tolerance protein CutA [Methanomicrobiales archaeon]|nr:divalent-cation tolerance protein CutA [Methanomicrobiales archaeon]NYT20196.1 divalent-cation tolerance protein CutA [Methanomicrobiales archaeon]